MQLTRFADVGAFYARAAAFLLGHEAANNLILGACIRVLDRPETSQPPRYLAVVEDDGAVVAAALFTPPYRPVLALSPLPAAAGLIAQELTIDSPELPGVLGPVAEVRAFVERWTALTGQPGRCTMAERIYELTAVTPPTGVPGRLRRVTPADRDLTVAWRVAFHAEALGEPDSPAARRAAEQDVEARLTDTTSAFYLWEDGGRPVSIAGTAGPTPHGIRIGGVYTPPAFRRRGYAGAAVAALSQRLLDEGHRYCFLFTDLSNPTSNHIYQAIGYRPVCDVDEYTFDPSPAAGEA